MRSSYLHDVLISTEGLKRGVMILCDFGYMRSVRKLTTAKTQLYRMEIITTDTHCTTNALCFTTFLVCIRTSKIYTAVMCVAVKVEVHSSSSGAGSDENLSSLDLSERSADPENDYEEIYQPREEKTTATPVRRSSRDSGSHSRSSSSSNSHVVIAAAPAPAQNHAPAQEEPSMTTSTGTWIEIRRIVNSSAFVVFISKANVFHQVDAGLKRGIELGCKVCWQWNTLHDVFIRDVLDNLCLLPLSW